MKWRAGLPCTRCGERFRSQRPYDRHMMRRPEWRCLSRQELLDRGWAYSRRRGGWTDSPRQRRFNFAAAARAVDLVVIGTALAAGGLVLLALHLLEAWRVRW